MGLRRVLFGFGFSLFLVTLEFAWLGAIFAG
jgi:hypothetical protein